MNDIYIYSPGSLTFIYIYIYSYLKLLYSDTRASSCWIIVAYVCVCAVGFIHSFPYNCCCCGSCVPHPDVHHPVLLPVARGPVVSSSLGGCCCATMRWRPLVESYVAEKCIRHFPWPFWRLGSWYASEWEHGRRPKRGWSHQSS